LNEFKEKRRQGGDGEVRWILGKGGEGGHPKVEERRRQVKQRGKQREKLADWRIQREWGGGGETNEKIRAGPAKKVERI